LFVRKNVEDNLIGIN